MDWIETAKEENKKIKTKMSEAHVDFCKFLHLEQYNVRF